MNGDSFAHDDDPGSWNDEEDDQAWANGEYDEQVCEWRANGVSEEEIQARAGRYYKPPKKQTTTSAQTQEDTMVELSDIEIRPINISNLQVRAVVSYDRPDLTCFVAEPKPEYETQLRAIAEGYITQCGGVKWTTQWPDGRSSVLTSADGDDGLEQITDLIISSWVEAAVNGHAYCETLIGSANSHCDDPDYLEEDAQLWYSYADAYQRGLDLRDVLHVAVSVDDARRKELRELADETAMAKLEYEGALHDEMRFRNAFDGNH